MNERGNVYPIDPYAVRGKAPCAPYIDGNALRRQSRIFAKAQKL